MQTKTHITIVINAQLLSKSMLNPADGESFQVGTFLNIRGHRVGIFVLATRYTHIELVD